jgi:hypothetical protein
VVDAPSLRRREIACAVAVVLALAAAAFLVVSVRARETARTDLAHARHALHVERTTSSVDAQTLNRSRHAVQSIGPRLTALMSGGATIAKLDDQDLATVRAALQAGLAGNLDAYNAAVDQRSSLDSQHDTSVEQLRQQANTVIGVLDLLTG